MDDDFNTSGAVAALFELSSEANRNGSGRSSGLMRAQGGILGLLQSDPATYLQSPTRNQPGSGSAQAVFASEQIEAMITERTLRPEERGVGQQCVKDGKDPVRRSPY